MLRSLLLSTASNASRFAIATVITLVMTPVYISELGNYDYGIWELLGSVVGYLGLLDMGLRPTISRFTAHFRRSNNDRDQLSLFSTSLALMGGVGLIISLLFVSWSLTFPGILAPQAEDAGRYAFVIQLFAIHVLVAFPYYALESVFEGRLWYTTKNNISIAHQVLGALFLYLYLPYYDPLVAMIGVNLASTVSKLAMLLGLLHTAPYGRYRIIPTSFDPALVSRLIRFGSKSLAQGIAGQVSKRSDALLIGILLGPQKIVFFNLAHMLIQRVRSLTQIVSHAFMPAFSAMNAANDQQAIERYFFAGTKFLYIIQAGTSLGVIVVGDAFISLWIGPEYGQAAKPLVWILALSTLIGGSLPLHNRLLTALDRHGRLAALYSARAVVNVLLTLALIPLLELVGVALATLLAHIIFTPLIWWVVFKQLEARPWDYIYRNLAPVVASGLVMALACVATSTYVGMQSWMGLLTVIVVGALVYALLLPVLALDTADRAFIHGTWSRAMGASRR